MQPNAEMSSGQATFDLKAAREACTKLYLPWTYFEPDGQIHSQLVETEYGEYGSVICRYQEEICQFLRETRSREIIAGVNKLPAALDEVERLQKALALKTEQHKGQAYVIGSYLGMLTDFNELNESQAKRIAELEAIFLDLREFLLKRKLVDSDQLDGCVAIAHAVKDAILNLTSEESELVSTFEQRSPGRYRYLENKVRILDQIYKDDCSEMRKLHAALKKLGKAKRDRGKALVEERARFNVAMKVVPLNTSFPNSDHKKAREQLRQEGKL